MFVRPPIPMRHPEQAEAVRGDGSLAAAAVEEGVRYDGPTQAMVRIATDEVEIGGTSLPRGARIFTMINAANRDPEQFPDPDRLDVRRELGRHIAFGYGIHFCLGAPLARMEGQIALPAVLARRPYLACADDRLVWLDSLVFRGVQVLPVGFGGR
jgi:pimeloyl-[acyl-carrier protein] synthase